MRLDTWRNVRAYLLSDGLVLSVATRATDTGRCLLLAITARLTSAAPASSFSYGARRIVSPRRGSVASMRSASKLGLHSSASVSGGFPCELTAEHPELLLLPSVRRDSCTWRTMSGGHGPGDPQVALRLMSHHHWLRTAAQPEPEPEQSRRCD